MAENSPITFYEILGIDRTASQAEIVAAHDSKLAEAEASSATDAQNVELINRAFATLNDLAARQQYDRYLSGLTADLAPATASLQPVPISVAPTQATSPATDQFAKSLKAIRRAAFIALVGGAAAILAGVLITFISYNATKAGGHYTVFYGIIVVGAISLIRGAYQMLYPYGRLHRLFDRPGMRAQFPGEKKGARIKAIVIVIVGSLLAAYLLIVAIAATSGSSLSNNSDTSSNANSAASTALLNKYNTCTDEYNALQAQLTTVTNQLTTYETNGDTADYNALVPKQNSLVDQIQVKDTECEGYSTQYNDSINQ